MQLAKPDRKDFDTTVDFFNAAELALERDRYGMSSPEENWQDLDEEDTDMILIKKLSSDIAFEEGIKPERVDNRILMYEFLKAKFARCSCNWRRVYWASEVLVDNVCDPTEDHLAFHPSFETFHVAPEC